MEGTRTSMERQERVKLQRQRGRAHDRNTWIHKEGRRGEEMMGDDGRKRYQEERIQR
jgi:hypothetical protein